LIPYYNDSHKQGFMQMNFKMSLKEGDTIAIVAPSGSVSEPEKLERACELFSKFNLKTKIYESCYKSYRCMAGTDEDRLKDLHDAFLDTDVKAIICARGGYGALRIVDDLDYGLIAENPKIFAGSSDITVLLLNIFHRAGLNTFHSPMALNGFDENIFRDFLSVVNGEKKEIAPKENFKTLYEGRNKGMLWGGNLATVVSLFGSGSKTYLPQENIILFLEDLNEPNYKTDRMLRQIYRNISLREKIKGLVFGDFLGSDNEKELEDILKEYAELFNIPASYGYNITHAKPNLTLPIGQSVDFDSVSGKILCI